MKSWANLCGEAAAFASEKGKDRLINISVSADQSRGVIIVWYGIDAANGGSMVVEIEDVTLTWRHPKGPACDISPCSRS